LRVFLSFCIGGMVCDEFDKFGTNVTKICHTKYKFGLCLGERRRLLYGMVKGARMSPNEIRRFLDILTYWMM
jgi:hypothetical protein